MVSGGREAFVRCVPTVGVSVLCNIQTGEVVISPTYQVRTFATCAAAFTEVTLRQASLATELETQIALNNEFDSALFAKARFECS